MSNYEHVFKGWATPLAVQPGSESSIAELLRQYHENKSRVMVSGDFKRVMEESPDMFPLQKIFHGCNYKRLGEAMGMQPFLLKLRPALVLAKCADGTYFAIEDGQIVSRSLRELYMKRYPRILGHIICESLGYATPSCAAQILIDAANHQPNWCEWISACYNCDPLPMLKRAVSFSSQWTFKNGRHSHTGYMAEYERAKALVVHAIATGKQPELASWF
jgi:hypothetical protein